MTRHVTAKLIAILFIGSFSLSMVAMLPDKPPTEEACSCPMCRMGAPGHHCSCCLKGRTCNCQMSANPQDQPPPRAIEPGLLRARMGLLVKLESGAFVSSGHISCSSPFLPVPTPPPKA